MRDATADSCFRTLTGSHPLRAIAAPGHKASRAIAERLSGNGPRPGYGACAKCPCAEFLQSWANASICERCGHSYGEHW